MHMIPGSSAILAGKEDPFAEVKIGKNMGDLFKTHPELKQMDSVALPMKAGAISFHNGLTAHGAGANMTCRPRRAMTMAMMPAEHCQFNGQQNVLTPAQAESLSIGEAITTGLPDQCPLLFGQSIDMQV